MAPSDARKLYPMKNQACGGPSVLFMTSLDFLKLSHKYVWGVALKYINMCTRFNPEQLT